MVTRYAAQNKEILDKIDKFVTIHNVIASFLNNSTQKVIKMGTFSMMSPYYQLATTYLILDLILIFCVIGACLWVYWLSPSISERKLLREKALREMVHKEVSDALEKTPKPEAPPTKLKRRCKKHR
jgi:hypothetical protein